MFGKKTEKEAEGPMAPAAFRDLYVAYLQNAEPKCKIELSSDLELKVSFSDSGEGSHSVFLDNAYQQYENAPENRDEILEIYIASFLEVTRQEEKEIDPECIVPVIKDRGWLEEIQASMEERGGDPDEMPGYLTDHYNSELAIFYAEDSPRNIRYLTEEAFDSIDVDRVELRARAIENLRRLVGDIEVAGGDGVYLVRAGGDYEASLLLVDSLWNQETLPVEGDFVAAIPSRDLLIVTGTGHPDAIEQVRQLASEGAAQFSYPLSPVLFIRRNERFEVFEG